MTQPLTVHLRAAGGATYDLAMPVPVVAKFPDANTTGDLYTNGNRDPYDNRYGKIVDGRLTITTNGAVLDSLDIPAWIDNKAQDVQITRNLLHPTVAPPTNVGVVTNRSGKRCLVQGNTLRPDVSCVWFTAVIGSNFEMRENDASHCVDLVGTYSTLHDGREYDLATIVDWNWLHDNVYISPDPNHKNDSVPHTHSDGWQHQDGFNVRFTRNRVENFIDPVFSPDILRDSAHKNLLGGYNLHFPSLTGNACIQITNLLGPVGDLFIDGNFFNGGGYSINVGPGTYARFGQISNNRFGRGLVYPQSAIGIPKLATADIFGNVWDDTGLPVSMSRS